MAGWQEHRGQTHSGLQGTGTGIEGAAIAHLLMQFHCATTTSANMKIDSNRACAASTETLTVLLICVYESINSTTTTEYKWLQSDLVLNVYCFSAHSSQDVV